MVQVDPRDTSTSDISVHRDGSQLKSRKSKKLYLVQCWMTALLSIMEDDLQAAGLIKKEHNVFRCLSSNAIQ